MAGASAYLIYEWREEIREEKRWKSYEARCQWRRDKYARAKQAKLGPQEGQS